MTLKEFLCKYNIRTLRDLSDRIQTYDRDLSVDLVYQAAEYLNPNRDVTAAYYTDTAICRSIMAELPAFDGRDKIRILEPSAGAGNFIPFIAEKYKDAADLELFLIDIDEAELQIAELIFETFYREKYPNVRIVYLKADYLDFSVCGERFDLVIGNPPYGKIGNARLHKKYRKNSRITKSSNLFVLFLEKALKDGEWVSLIVPKSVLNAPEYEEIRRQIGAVHIRSVLDFGENGFKGVKIETVNLLYTASLPPAETHIVSVTQNLDLYQKQAYCTDADYPVWLLYRDRFFDEFASSLILGVFEVFRDRQIVNGMLGERGKYRVLKSRNIASNAIRDLAGYDAYIDDVGDLAVAKFLNEKEVVLVPNLSYAPRACFLPADTIANGSVALLTLKDRSYRITQEDLALFATEEFTRYYRIARNYGTRSLNIDNNSVYFFGIRRKLHDRK